MVAAVAFDEVSCAFGTLVAVDRVSLEVREGEFFTLLGPSGSGKTTCLMMLAGFETPNVSLKYRRAGVNPAPALGVGSIGLGEKLFLAAVRGAVVVRWCGRSRSVGAVVRRRATSS